MIFTKQILFAGMMTLTASVLQAQTAVQPTGKYRLYLYFGDTKPFTDELTLKAGARGIEGVMHVPNDFDAAIERPVMTSDGNLAFHVTLPHKYDQAFPKGLDYSLQFESPRASGTAPRYDHDVGFVEQTANQNYVGSIVGFLEE